MFLTRGHYVVKALIVDWELPCQDPHGVVLLQVGVGIYVGLCAW